MVIKSDEFNGTSLNTSTWTITDPRNDSTISIANGKLSIFIPSTVNHDSWGPNGDNYAARITQVHDNTDFEVEVKFDSIPSLRFQQQGILVEQDAANYLRFDFLHDGTNLILFSATTINNNSWFNIYNPISPSNPSVLYLRVKKIGDQWIQTYSIDGITWLNGANFSQIITANNVGIFAGNQGSPIPAYTSVVEYFRNTQLSPVPISVAHWAFEESDAHILDSSGNGFDGTIYGGLTRTSGIIGNALLTDGINGSYANVKTISLTKVLPIGLAPRSISAWIYMLEYTPQSFIFFYGSPSDKSAFYLKTEWADLSGGAWELPSNDIVSPGYIMLNKWYHVCLTYDGTTAILYGAGVELGRKTVSWNLIDRAEGGYINIDWQGLSPAKLKIDEIKVFDKSLSSAEVLQESNEVTPTCDPVICNLNIV